MVGQMKSKSREAGCRRRKESKKKANKLVDTRDTERHWRGETHRTQCDSDRHP